MVVRHENLKPAAPKSGEVREQRVPLEGRRKTLPYTADVRSSVLAQLSNSTSPAWE